MQEIQIELAFKSHEQRGLPEFRPLKLMSEGG